MGSKDGQWQEHYALCPMGQVDQLRVCNALGFSLETVTSWGCQALNGDRLWLAVQVAYPSPGSHHYTARAKVRHRDADRVHGVQGKGFHNLFSYFLSWLGFLQPPQQPLLLATVILAALSTLCALADAMNLNRALLRRLSSMPASRF